MITVCPHCKRPMAPAVDVHGPVRQRVYDYIAKHPEGVTRGQVIDAVYADCPNGGPNNGNVVSVHVLRINEQLLAQRIGLRIAARGGPGSTYRLVTL